MDEALSVLMAEDDDGHATLVRRNLKRAGLKCNPVHLRDGQEMLDLGVAARLVKPLDYGAFNDLIQRLADCLMAARLPGEVPARRQSS